MNDNEDIRRALADLAGNPAPRDLKPGVHQRVAELHRRRQSGTALALSVLTLATGLTLSRLPAMRGENPTAQSSPNVSASPSPSTETDTSATPTTKAASSKPTQAVALPTTTARTGEPSGRHTNGSTSGQGASTGTATSAPATTATTSGGPATKKPSTAAGTAKPSVTPSASTTSGPDPTKESLEASLTAVTDADGSDAPYTTLTLHVTGKIYGSLNDVDMGYRESGGRSGIHREYKSAGPCVIQTGQLHDVDQSFTFRYRFRLAGTYTPSAKISAWDHNCTYGVPRREWSLLPTVTIARGSSLSNGPEPIVINISAKAQGAAISLGIASDDSDGHIRTTTVDWGAGGAPVDLGGDAKACDDSGGRYWPDSYARIFTTSPNLAPGTYTVTVTTTSTGCDGKDSQSATKQATVVIA
jgi:hypothetical protein